LVEVKKRGGKEEGRGRSKMGEMEKGRKESSPQFGENNFVGRGGKSRGPPSTLFGPTK
jgi:hypothetical protein